MKKILSLLASIGLISTSLSTVVACDEDPTISNDDNTDTPVVKEDLTDEKLEQFVNDNSVVNFSGAFLFEEGKEVSHGILARYNLIIKNLAMEEFYKLLNVKFNYSDFSLLGFSAKMSDEPESFVFESNKNFSFKVFFAYRSESSYNENKNRAFNFTFNFTQTEKITTSEILEKYFDASINTRFYKNNNGFSTSINPEIEIYNEVYLDVSTEELNDLATNELRIALLTERFQNAYIKRETEGNFTPLDVFDINIENYKIITDYVNTYSEAYLLNIKLTLKSDASISFQKQINTIISKN